MILCGTISSKICFLLLSSKPDSLCGWGYKFLIETKIFEKKIFIFRNAPNNARQIHTEKKGIYFAAEWDARRKIDEEMVGSLRIEREFRREKNNKIGEGNKKQNIFSLD